jgi:hypothetical protein
MVLQTSRADVVVFLKLSPFSGPSRANMLPRPQPFNWVKQSQFLLPRELQPLDLVISSFTFGWARFSNDCWARVYVGSLVEDSGYSCPGRLSRQNAVKT